MRRIDTALDIAIERIANELGTRRAVVIMFFLPFAALPGVIGAHSAIALVLWLSSEFLQLFFLPVLLRAGNQQADRIELLTRETHDTQMSVLDDIKAISAALHVAITGEEHPAA